MLIFVSCAPPAKLSVWHAWHGTELEILEEIAANYKKTTGIEVELHQFESAAVLRENLLEVTTSGDGPDVFLGYHTWADELIDKGLVKTMCAPGRECPECETENRPNWCTFAYSDFGYRITKDFAIDVLCKLGQCPDSCEDSINPRFCELATVALEPKLDIPHAAFATLVDGTVLPFGIPIWWEYEGIFVNTDIADKELPVNLEGLDRFVKDELGGVYYNNSFISQTGLEVDTVPLPESTNPNVDPVVAGILVASSDEFVRLQSKVGQFTHLPLEDYRPQILVHGAYMNAHTSMRSQAIEFVYTLGNKNAQHRLFENTGHLPAHGEVLAEIEGGVIIEGKGIGNLLEFGKNGLLADPFRKRK